MMQRKKSLVIRLSALEETGSGSVCTDSAPREFHISRAAREKYSFSEDLYSLRGNVIFPNFSAVRQFVLKVNTVRDSSLHPERAMRSGHVNAMGLVDEILHYVVRLYRQQMGSGVFREAADRVRETVGTEAVDSTLLRFVEDFPPLSVHRGELDAAAYLKGKTDGVSNKEIALEEMLLLWLANDNPAFGPFGEFFDDTDLRGTTAYLGIIAGVKEFFHSKPVFGPDNEHLVEMLKAPAQAFPDSLQNQLTYIRKRWGLLLGDFLERLLRGLDFLTEEEKARFGGGPGPSEVYEYRGSGYSDEEFERFSPDKDWMPKVILIAKSTFVWLDQLSRTYNRMIKTLDAIPDEELDILANRGINGLWLIGVWERSQASRRIKELCGNPEAEASAYSLHEYEVAWNLGGWAALENLRRRAWKRGIRLASDMVPNHTGLDSRWVNEHPEWFVQSDHPPFPGYTFTRENLSSNPDIGLFLEDHYYERTDAAVVFKRVHWQSGDTRYIYHGNDGTHMPWNDTAQLNFLLPDLREAVIQTILHVARNFPIIRFDAAMTLAKRHYQRLWYPEPGSGGDIPSRAERGLSKDEFNRLFPVEFWREVVDRAAAECPDTLLLAEAFWMMEGYFVRTLGMHRVYNSAFMNMLKNEDNEKYRATIKNTQEFDPDILKRFVNFMNNPDEDTAIAQFGDGDKYFGVCTLMITMPGLPMFGHGQIEGFREKYGMEYRRAYWDEVPSGDLISRHEREIFPLLKKRHLFAEVENFLLFDLYKENGSVDENVFAYSNRSGDESALVLYNNSYEKTQGWIKSSAAFMEKSASGDKSLKRRDIAEGLRLHRSGDWYCVFREQRSGLWFIRNTMEIYEKGLFVTLNGYESQVFLDFYEVFDDAKKTYRRLAEYLSGGGTRDVEESLREIIFAPLYASFRTLFDSQYPLLEEKVFGLKPFRAESLEPFLDAFEKFFRQAESFADAKGDFAAAKICLLETCPRLAASVKAYPPAEQPEKALVLLWATLRCLGFVLPAEKKLRPEAARDLVEDWGLDKEVFKFLSLKIDDEEKRHQSVTLLKLLLAKEDWFEWDSEEKVTAKRARSILEKLLSDEQVSGFCGVNIFEGTTYFNREGFLELLRWLGFTEKSIGPKKSSGFCALYLKAFKNAGLQGIQASGFGLCGKEEAGEEKGERRCVKVRPVVVKQVGMG